MENNNSELKTNAKSNHFNHLIDDYRVLLFTLEKAARRARKTPAEVADGAETGRDACRSASATNDG